MGLDRDDVQRALEAILAVVPDGDFRLVGTASCVLRGIEMAANDVDVLFRERGAIDAWAVSVADVANLTDGPSWLDEASQYFARFDYGGVSIELSTVEIDTDTDTAECVGSGPWIHFDQVPCAGFTVPSVALELRLVTEVTRRRADRWQPIVAYFRSHRCDVALVERGLVAQGISPDEIAAIVGSLSTR
ncbi:MAG: hypothetical protein ACXVKP_20335 [Ilumatobacteraceae bacterium]